MPTKLLFLIIKLEKGGVRGIVRSYNLILYKTT